MRDRISFKVAAKFSLLYLVGDGGRSNFTLYPILSIVPRRRVS